MSFVPFKLRKDTELTRRSSDGETFTMTLPKDTMVRYERREENNQTVDEVRYTHDGYVWSCIKRTPKQPEKLTIVASTPVDILSMVPTKEADMSEHTQQAVSATAQTAAHAVGVLARRGVNGDDANEKHVRGLARAAEMLRGDVFQVNYYIPSVLNDQVDNPSRIFRRHGFRLDGSNWVFPQHGLEHDHVQKVLKEWDDMTPVEEQTTLPGFQSQTRVRYWVIKYTPEQLAQMRDLAHSQLADELQKTHRSLIERIESASKDLQDAMDALPDCATEKDRSALDTRYNGRIRTTITEAVERFEMCLKGAEIFDETGSLDAIFGAVREAIKVRALAANAMLYSKGAKRVAIPASITAPMNPSIGSGPAPR